MVAQGSRADHFELIRDGSKIATLPKEARHYFDMAARGPAPSAPTGLRASQGTSADGVQLNWAAASSQPGATHQYSVVAYQDGTPSAPGGPATGNRAAAPVEGYELSRDDGQTWHALPGILTEAFDREAPYAQVTPGRTLAEALLQPAHAVRLTLQGLVIKPAFSAYRVRALSRGAAGDPSSSAQGHRIPPAPRIQWEAAKGDDVATLAFRELAGVTGPSFWDRRPRREARVYRAAIRVGSDAVIHSQPDVAERIADVSAVASSRDSRCVVLEGTSLTCKGDSTVRIPEAGLTGEFASISSDYTLCALDNVGRRQCWGRNDFGSAPPEQTKTRYLAVDVGAPLCMIRQGDNLLECRGTFSSHETNPYPRDVPARDLSVSQKSICVVQLDGPIRCWGGQDYRGQYPVFGPTEAHYLQVHTDDWDRGFCAIRDTGALECFDSRGRQVAAPKGSEGLRFSRLDQAVAITREGRLFRYGEGLVDTEHRYIAISGDCALRDDGELRCAPEDDLLPLDGTFVDLRVGDDVCGVDATGAERCRSLEQPFAKATGSAWTGRVKARATALGDTYDLDDAGHIHCSRFSSWDPSATYPEGACFDEAQRYAAVAASPDFACGLRAEDGQIDCLARRLLPPAPVALFTGRYVELQGHGSICALRVGGGAECFVDDEWSPVPRILSDPLRTGATGHLVMTHTRTCALDAQGVARCQDYSGDSTPFGAQTLRTLVASSDQLCGLTLEGRVVCEEFSRQHLWLGAYLALAAGPHGVCGLRDDGKVVCDHPYGAWDARSLVTP